MKRRNLFAWCSLLIALALLSGCAGVDRWWKREHALMPLKEQYWSGDLSWPEYRDKKRAVIEELERHDYKTYPEIRQALAEKAADEHGGEPEVAPKKAASDEIILLADEKMIHESETAEGAEAAAAQEIAAAREMAPTPELVTDSEDVGWVKDDSGKLTWKDGAPVPAATTEAPPTDCCAAALAAEPDHYEATDEPINNDALFGPGPVIPAESGSPDVLPEQTAEGATSEKAETAPVAGDADETAVSEAPAVPAEEEPVEEKPAPEGDPAHVEEEPVILDLGDFSMPEEDAK